MSTLTQEEVTHDELAMLTELRAMGYPRRYDTIFFTVRDQTKKFVWWVDASDPHGGWMLEK